MEHVCSMHTFTLMHLEPLVCELQRDHHFSGFTGKLNVCPTSESHCRVCVFKRRESQLIILLRLFCSALV